MWIQDKFFKYTIATVLILTIVWLLYQTAPVFAPILWFVAAILLPILFSTILYYMLRPIVNFLEGFRIPRYVAILIIYFFIFAFVMALSLIGGPKIIKEIAAITDISPEKINALKLNTNTIFEKFTNYLPESQLPALQNVLFGYVQSLNTYLYEFIFTTITTLASIAIAIALTPFVLFYFLNDGHALPKFLLKFIPLDFKDEVQTTLNDIDEALSGFILAQITVALVVGVFLLLGYVIIGLPQALVLALFAMVFYMIPILGTFIAIIPALLIGMSISVMMAVKVIVVMFAAHFLEANVISPRLMSRRLKIHPLTIILLLLAGGSLFGLLGLLLATPTYAILKVVLWNTYKILRFHTAAAVEKPSKS